MNEPNLDSFAIRVFGKHKWVKEFHRRKLEEYTTAYIHVVHAQMYKSLLGVSGPTDFRPAALDGLLPVVGLPSPTIFYIADMRLPDIGIQVSCFEWIQTSPRTPHADEVGYWAVDDGVWKFHRRTDYKLFSRWDWSKYELVQE